MTRVAYLDSERLASTGRDGTTRLWDVISGGETTLEPENAKRAPRTALAVSGQGWIASGTENGLIDVWIRGSSHPGLEPLPLNGRPVNALAFSPDGMTLVVAGDAVVAIDIDFGKVLREFQRSGYVKTVAYSPDGSRVHGLNSAGFVETWDAATGKAVGLGAQVTGMSSGGPMTRDPQTGRIIYANKTILNVTEKVGSPPQVFTGHTAAVSVIADLRSEGFVSAAGNVVKVWSSGAVPIHTVSGAVQHFDVSRDGRYLATIPPDDRPGRLVVRDLIDGSVISEMDGKDVTSIAFAPDGQRFVTGWRDGRIRRHRTKDGAIEWVASAPHAVTEIAVSPDARWVATAMEEVTDKSVRVWDFVTGRPVCAIPGSEQIAFSPDGTLLATGGLPNFRPERDKRGALFDFWQLPGVNRASASACRWLRGGGAPTVLRDVAFSSDGRRLVTANDHVEVWDVATASGLRVLAETPLDPVGSVTFLDDSSRVAAVVENQLTIWDTETGYQLLRSANGPTWNLRWRGERLFGRSSLNGVTILSGRRN